MTHPSDASGELAEKLELMNRGKTRVGEIRKHPCSVLYLTSQQTFGYQGRAGWEGRVRLST
jgi:hypothetical protein